jgi:hypothetical protein
VDIEMDKESSMFLCTLNRQKLRKRCRREGRYMLRTNLTENDPALLWRYYMPLVAVEQAFKNLKGIWRSVLSSIKTSVGLRLISSSRSWPTACRSRSSAAFMPADSDEASHRFRPKPATCSD